jgi:hypothetical protein
MSQAFYFEALSQRIKNMAFAAVTKNIKSMYSSSDFELFG